MKRFLKQTNNTKERGDEFIPAQSWSDDVLSITLARANQFKLASGALLLLCLGLGSAIAVLVPLQKTQLVVVHQSNNGVVWVDAPNSLQALPTQVQTESEIVNYVTKRESYSAFSYDYQYRLIHLLSSEAVAKIYRATQDANNPASPIAQLGQDGTQTAQVEDVIFLDNDNLNSTKDKKTHHTNLAQVDFTLTTKQKSQSTTTPYTALLSWTYRGTPDNPQAKWQNWDGFTVTQYQLTQHNVITPTNQEATP